MKKIYLSLIAVLSVCNFTYAQWTISPTNPNNTYYNLTGNVGIGTSGPTSNLHLFEMSDSKPGGNLAPTKSIFKLSRAGTPNYSYNESAEFRIGHGGPYVWGSQLDLFINGGQNSSNIPDQQVMTWLYNGNVGIGTTSPGAALSIVNISPVIQLFSAQCNTQNGSSLGRLAFGSTCGEFASIEATRSGTAYDDVTLLKFKTSWATGAGGDGTNMERMRINPNGNIGIGTANPDQKLTVKGTIHSLAVIVDNNIIPDYVFNPDYKLVSLKDVKAYIDKNHHLSEIPSAKTIAKQGLNLGTMNTLLLKKVEELTLYTLASDKAIKNEKVVVSQAESLIGQQQEILLQQQAQIKAQQAQIDALNKKMELVLNTITNK